MQPIEIVVIVGIVLFVGAIIGRFIYKKVHHMPSGECSCCQKRMNKAVKCACNDVKKEMEENK